MELIASLISIGLTRPEAELYVLMHKEGPMTGYEASKLSGISRSNAYPALSSLVEKGAAHRIDGEVQRYLAVEIGDFCRSRKRHYDLTFSWLKENMPQRQDPAEPFFTVTGEQNILDQVQNMIEKAGFRIYLTADSLIIYSLVPSLKLAASKGIKIVLITDAGLDIPGALIYQMNRKPGQIRLIADSQQVLTGEISSKAESSCLYSRNKAFVTLLKEAMMNELALIRLAATRKGDNDKMAVYSFTKQNNFFGNSNPDQLLRKYGSPLYVYNESIFRSRCREMQQLIKGQPFTSNYSIKANSNLQLLKIARAEGLFADAMSPGEILALEKAGFSSEQIFFVPNNVDADEFRFALERDILISCDSLDQVELLGQTRPGCRLAVRINPGVGAGHHEKVVTAGKKTKFGISMDKIGQLNRLLERYDLKLEGINQHIGSLFMEPEAYLEAARHFLDLAKQFKDLRIIDFGGGFGIPYKKLSGQPRLDLADLSARLSEIVAGFAKDYPHELLFKAEPGRYISAESGVLLGSVNAIKENGGTVYAGTDVGFNVLARPVMYESWHDIEVYRDAEPVLSMDTRPVTVVGNICESGDIIARDRELPEILRGDVLAILDAGAYGYSMSSNYNNRLRPAEVLIMADGSDQLIRRRDTYEDLFRQFEI